MLEKGTAEVNPPSQRPFVALVWRKTSFNVEEAKLIRPSFRDFGDADDEVCSVGVSGGVEAEEAGGGVLGEVEGFVVVEPSGGFYGGFETGEGAGACATDADCDVGVARDGKVMNKEVAM